MKTISLLTVVLLFSGLAAAAPASADELLILKPQFRSAAELLPALRAALGDGGTVALDERTDSLVLSGDAAALGRAKQALATLDVKPRTVFLRVQVIGADEYENLGAAVTWTVAGGGWRVGRLGDRATGVRAAAAKRIDHSSDAARLELRVLEGHSANLITTRQTTYEPDVFGSDERRGSQLRGRIRQKTYSLEVTPRIVGTEIYLEIKPHSLIHSPQENKAYPLIETSTTVQLADGESFLLAAAHMEAQDHAHCLLGSLEQSTAAATSRTLLVEAKIEDENNLRR